MRTRWRTGKKTIRDNIVNIIRTCNTFALHVQHVSIDSSGTIVLCGRALTLEAEDEERKASCTERNIPNDRTRHMRVLGALITFGVEWGLKTLQRDSDPQRKKYCLVPRSESKQYFFFRTQEIGNTTIPIRLGQQSW